jgi:coenzyme F420-reducing hydrogenase alpha subunit
MRRTIDVHHLPRIEGHGNIVIRVSDGRLEEARWDVVETPRYFEVMLKGKHYSSAAMLTSRICGICSISHTLASLRATEKAFGIEIPETAQRLRLLAKHAETLQSHALHLFFLAAPDLFGVASAVDLIEKEPEVVQLALQLKGLGNRICDTVAGRTTHPLTFQVGGVTQMPPADQLQSLQDELRHSLSALDVAVDLFAGIELPRFERETEFVSLKGDDSYPFIGGDLISSDRVERTEHDYLVMTNEYVDPSNTSKWSKLSRESYAVGALARFNNSSARLRPEAQEVAARLGLTPVCHQPFMHNIARLVECVHCTYEAIGLIEELAADTGQELRAPVEPHAGEGVGAVEAPRGILFHHYQYDESGRVTRANCVVPTTQNNGNIHRDLPQLVARQLELGADDRQLEQVCSMLVRAYDPCLSCSVH